MQLLLADPPAFTPSYDHALATALARAGLDVELVTSPFRFGETARALGYRRTESFYPLSSRLFRRSRLRVPFKLAEHVIGMSSLMARSPSVLHLQWLAVPELDRHLLRPRVPAVFTAHDLLPRRTAKRVALWRRLYDRFDAVVVHSERGARTLTELGVNPAKLRVIPAPVFPRPVERRDDGRTVLFFGVIRPYRGLTDALSLVERLEGTRLIVAGEPVQPVRLHRERGDGRVDWRLGYLSEDEVDRAHAEATIAVFPYRPEIDQSGSLLRALGSGVPAVVYDVGGLPDPVRAYGAGRVVDAGDVDGLVEAARSLLDDPEALAEARAGVARARRELTWETAAEAHLAVYRDVAEEAARGRAAGPVRDDPPVTGKPARLVRREDPGLSQPGAWAADRIVGVAITFAILVVGAQTVLGLVNGLLLDHRYRLLDPDREYTAFSWGSAVATFAAAFALLLLAAVRERHRGQLTVLAALISFVSLSDLVVIHEPLTRRLFVHVLGLPLGLGARMSSVLFFPLLATALVLLLLQARRAPRRPARAIVGGLALLALAVGLELFNGVLSALGLITFRQPLDVVIATAEEGVELAGWILIAGGLAAVVCAHFVELGFRAGSSQSPPGRA